MTNNVLCEVMCCVLGLNCKKTSFSFLLLFFLRFSFRRKWKQNMLLRTRSIFQRTTTSSVYSALQCSSHMLFWEIFVAGMSLFLKQFVYLTTFVYLKTFEMLSFYWKLESYHQMLFYIHFADWQFIKCWKKRSPRIVKINWNFLIQSFFNYRCFVALCKHLC